MLGGFVVEVEAASGGAGANGLQAPLKVVPAQRAGPGAGTGGRGLGVVHRLEWVAAETIEQIHQQQFLVLLFVLQAQFHQGLQGWRRRFA